MKIEDAKENEFIISLSKSKYIFSFITVKQENESNNLKIKMANYLVYNIWLSVVERFYYVDPLLYVLLTSWNKFHSRYVYNDRNAYFSKLVTTQTERWFKKGENQRWINHFLIEM